MNFHASSQTDEVDELLTALADPHGRVVLDYFQDAAEPTATVTTLARWTIWMAIQSNVSSNNTTARCPAWTEPGSLTMIRALIPGGTTATLS